MEPGYFEDRFTYHQDGPYGVNGTLFFDMPGNEVAEFDSVMLCTYDSDGTVLDATNLGTISAPSEVKEVRVFVDRQPRYIVIDHPGFAEYEFPDDPSISPLTIEWTDEAIFPRHQGAEAVIDEFDYERPEEPGECYRGG